VLLALTGDVADAARGCGAVYTLCLGARVDGWWRPGDDRTDAIVARPRQRGEVGAFPRYSPGRVLPSHVQLGRGGGTGIQGGFTRAANGSFTGSNCSITFTYNGNPVPVAGSPVAAGRIWGHIDCPNAMQGGTVEIRADGSTTDRACDAQADFLFENCE
jgi:hypothetical protein